MLLRGIGLGGWMLQEGYMLRINKAGQQHKMRAAFEELAGKESTDEFYEAWLSFITAGRSGGTVAVMLDDKIPVKLLFEATATELKWAISVIKNIPLSAGTHSLRVKVQKGGFNLKSMHFDQH
jgi:hypothetical protein